MIRVLPNSSMATITTRDVNMEVDRVEVGSKRRCHTPLIEVEGENGNGKRVKVEGEVKELGKVLKQYLGFSGGCGATSPGTMSALAWNCKGLGNPLTVKTLQKFVKEEDPTLVFLMETKFKITEMEGIKRKIERQHGLVVPCQNRGGGLALLWKDTLQVEPLTYSQRHIGVIVNEEGGKKRWRFTSFYGNPETCKWEESWTMIFLG